MPAKPKRNRSAEATAAGRILRAFELSPAADQAIPAIAEYLTTSQGRTRPATKVEAVEWALAEAAKKISKKIAKTG